VTTILTQGEFEFSHFVLSFSSYGIYAVGNDSIKKLTESLTRYSDNNNICLKYVWIRENSLSGDSHNYRVFLLYSGQNESNSSIIFNKVNVLWKSIGIVNYSLSDNVIMIDKKIPDYIDKIEKIILIISHYAKAVNNGFCSSVTREFGSSRL